MTDSEESRIRQLTMLGVRRYGEDGLTPIVLDSRQSCGTVADHIARGCIGMEIHRGGSSSLIHFTNEEALRLADLLRAMAETNQGS